MKKISLVILSIILLLNLCGCGEKPPSLPQATPTPIIEVAPTDIISIEDAAAVINYAPVIDGGSITKEGDKSSVLYRSEPIGSGDIIKVSVTQYTKEITKEQIKTEFDTGKSKRPKAIDIGSIENCYLAYPSIHLYKDGYHIEITAGSGGEDAQKQLLEQLASRALENLNKLIAK